MGIRLAQAFVLVHHIIGDGELNNNRVHGFVSSGRSWGRLTVFVGVCVIPSPTLSIRNYLNSPLLSAQL
jgi:hypothetical protein